MKQSVIMRSNRRDQLKALMATAFLSFAGSTRQAIARSYPTKPIRWIVPYGAGGATDITARLTAKYWEPVLPGNFVIDNKPGGQTLIGTQGMLTSLPDGYTILSVVENLPILPAMYKKLPFDADRDFTFISTIARMPFFLLVRKESPIKTMSEAILEIRARGEKMNYGSYGIGGTAHMAMEALGDALGVQMTHIPYQGAAACMNALLAGDIDITFADTMTSTPFVRGERVRPLALSTKERSPVFPEVPTLNEEGIRDFNWYGWHGVVAHRGTPTPIVNTLRETLNKALENPALRKEFSERGQDIFLKSGNDFRQYVATETKNLRDLVEKRNIKIAVE